MVFHIVKRGKRDILLERWYPGRDDAAALKVKLYRLQAVSCMTSVGSAYFYPSVNVLKSYLRVSTASQLGEPGAGSATVTFPTRISLGGLVAAELKDD